ncbi:MAG: hypothetical protein M3068_06850 [Gemmatimonadota bacterium]|nr:hypothetical protein [Gemmatimonadota bacterium]
MPRTRSLLIAITCAGWAACTDSTGPGGPPPASGLVVLNGSGATGVTTLSLTSLTSAHIDFGSGFNGAVMSLQNDTVLSTSSDFGGDLLYIADLPRGTVRKVQLAAPSNPAGATFVAPGALGGDAGHFLVALSGLQSLEQVAVSPSGTVSTKIIAGAGRCPFDVAMRGDVAWTADANEACEGDYRVLGPGALVGVHLTTSARDRIALPALAVGPSRVFIIGDDAFVLAIGCNPAFATGCLDLPASVTRVNLVTRQISVLQLPTGVYGESMQRGRDGKLYVVGYEGGFVTHLFTVDPQTLSFVGPFVSGTKFRSVLTQSGTQAPCVVATAGSDGTIFCLVNGQASATVIVATPPGAFVRSLAAGSPGFDIAVR